MHKFYFVLHIVLGATAIAGTLWGWQSFQQARDTVSRVQKKDHPSVSSQPETTGSARTSERNATSFPGKNILWEEFLFSPQRSERVDTAETDSSEKDQSKVDMELVGIGSLGSKSAAIIFVKSRGRNKKGNKRHVYVKGSQVEDTGYTVDKISFKEVTLVRGDGEEERVLRIHRQDNASQGRSKTAVKHAAQARQASRKEEKEKAREEEKNKASKSSSASQPEPDDGSPGGDESKSQRSQEQGKRLNEKERKERLEKLREIMKRRRQRMEEARKE